MKHQRFVVPALLALLCLGWSSCAAPAPNRPAPRPRYKNLDRYYDWGSKPPPGPMETHHAD